MAERSPVWPATDTCEPAAGRAYSRFLQAAGLRGPRIGIPLAFDYEGLTVPTEKAPRGGLNDAQATLMAEAIEILKREGAVVVDPANLPSVTDPDPAGNILLVDICSGINSGKGKDANCSVVLKYGMKRDFNAYLATLEASAPVKSLTDLRIFNLTHLRGNAIRY